MYMAILDVFDIVLGQGKANNTSNQPEDQTGRQKLFNSFTQCRDICVVLCYANTADTKMGKEGNLKKFRMNSRDRH